MSEQLSSTPQPAHRRIARGAYWRGLSATFRVGKPPRSSLFNRFKPQAEWPGHDDAWPSLESYAAWLPKHVRWKPDGLNGIIDVFPNKETIAAQFRDKGIFEDDCDGLAFFSAQNVKQFVEDPSRIYVTSVILDPFTFAQNPLLYSAHVICVFQIQQAWRVISNDTLYPQQFASFPAAVQTNPYCASHPVLWAEVRDADLKFIAGSKDLAELEQKLAARHG
ncbi:MAG: hypothetical protein J5I90_05670 [Caldilineales bacterium]|nr:hypothetical protein [Caldilineales bacterium]